MTDLKHVPRRTSGLATGECLSTTAGVTVVTKDEGSACSICNSSGTPINLTPDSGMTVRLAGSASTGTLVLAARGMAYLWYDTSTDVYVTGNVTT